MRRLSLLLLYCLFTALEGRGQSVLPVASLTIRDGLSQGMVFDMVQTHDGFMWFGTKDGLNRYDGYHFTVFRHSASDSFSIADNKVMRLFEDSRHRLWLQTPAGLDLYDPATQGFRHFRLPQHIFPSTYQNEQCDIVESADGSLWVSSGAAEVFQVILRADRRWETAPIARLESALSAHRLAFPEAITDLEPDASNGLYLGSASHCFWLPPGSSTPTEIFPPRYPTSWYSAAIVPAPGGEKLVFGPDGVFRSRNGGAEAPVPQKLAPLLRRFSYDSQGFLWLSAANSPRIFRIPVSALATNDFQQQAEMFTTDAVITRLYTDRNGNIWMGTNGYGVRRYTPNTRHFHHLLAGQTIAKLRKDAAGNLYFRQFRGIYRASPPRYMPAGIKRVADGLGIDVLPNPNGSLWLLTSRDTVIEGTDNQLLLLDAADHERQRLALPFPVYQQTVICRDANGGLWINPLLSAVVKADPRSGQTQAFSYAHLFAGQTQAATVLYADGQNTLWIGTNAGLIAANQLADSLGFRLFRSGLQANSLPGNRIAALCDDPLQPARYLWVGTYGSGLARLDKATGACLLFSEKEGLPNAVVYGILPDNLGRLWLSTNRGLAQFDPESHLFRPYTYEDGLQDDEFNTLSFFRTPQGELCFGGVNGANVFFPEDLQPNTLAPLVSLVEVRVNNVPLPARATNELPAFSPNQPENIILSYTQNYLAFSFAALDFTNTRKNRFRYQLEGADRDWIEAGSQPVANYTALPPGVYTFRVMGCNANGIWSQQAATLRIIIRPPWWRTWWAYTAYGLLLFAGLSQLYRYQIQRVRLASQLHYEQAEAQRLSALDALKTRFFSNVTHEFRTPLTLILEPLRRLRLELSPGPHDALLEIAENNGQKLLQLVNQLLDLSKLEGGLMQVRRQPGDVVACIGAVVQGFEPLARKNGIRLQWHPPATSPMVAFDRDKLEKILYNLINNALKFTPEAGWVAVRVDIAAERLKITVQDSGIGMDASTLKQVFGRFYQADTVATRRGEGTGIGLALVRELAELMGGNIEASSAPGQGSTFTVELPVSPATAAAAPPEMPLLLPSYMGKMPENQENESGNLVLLVEDNDDMRAYLYQVLSGDGYRVAVAPDGVSGLEQAFALIPDLILSDVMMPNRDGYELTHLLKNDLRTSHIPVLLLSARSNEESKLTGLRTGADEYLPKPFNTEELLLRIRNMLALRQKIQAQFVAPPTNVLSAPAPPELSQPDRKLLQLLTDTINAHLDDDTFDVEVLTETLGLSRSQLHRKMVALTGQSAMEFVRNYRLDRAHALLHERFGNVTEVAWATGFKDPKHFSTAFRKRFGVPPSGV